ncbi:hypothetical protein BC833DRAFT_662187, partial [Globomyces pollinis-pini]
MTTNFNWPFDSATGKLDLSDDEFDEHLLKEFLMEMNVRILYIYGNTHLNISNFIEACNKLVELNLDHCRIGDQGFALIQQHCSQLRKLSLRNNRITKESGRLLYDFLHQNTNLEVLYLSQNNLSDDGISFISQSLISNKSLHTLHISYNSIGVVGCTELARVLESSTTLTTLSCMNNPFGTEGLEILLNAMKENHYMNALILGFSQPYDERVVVDNNVVRVSNSNFTSQSLICKYLHTNPFISSLVYFGVLEFSSLSEALAKNTLLEYFSLVQPEEDDNLEALKIKDSSILNSFSRNRTLTEFVYQGYQLQDRQREKLQDIILRNVDFKSERQVAIQSAFLVKNMVKLLNGHISEDIGRHILFCILYPFNEYDSNVILSYLTDDAYTGSIPPDPFSVVGFIKHCYRVKGFVRV